MEDPRILVTLVAIIGYALASRALDRWWVSMPAAMMLLGVVAGPLGLGVIDVALRSEMVKTTAELTLALMLFYDAVRIDLRALMQGYAVPLRLLGIGLPLMLVLGSVVAYWFFPEVGIVGAALIATMLAPTDAALGAAVASDQRVPVRIRQGLSIESGLNDGLSVPVFLVLLAMAAEPASREGAALVTELVRQIGLGTLAGLVMGGGGGALFRLAVSRDAIDDIWRRVAVAVIALACFILAAVLGGSGFIGAFVGGMAFGLASEARSAEDNAFTDYLGTAFDATSFFLLGVAVLPYVLEVIDAKTVAYAIASLVVIRMCTVAVALLGSGAKWPTVMFMGWFGPRGLATLVFSVLVFDEQIPYGDIITSTAIAGVMLSVLAHGFTAPPLVRAYAAWWSRESAMGTTPMEDRSVHEHRLRMAHSTARARGNGFKR